MGRSSNWEFTKIDGKYEFTDWRNRTISKQTNVWKGLNEYIIEKGMSTGDREIS